MHADHQKAAATNAEATTAAIANACDEEPNAGAAAPVEEVAVEVARLEVAPVPLGLAVVVVIPLEPTAVVVEPAEPVVVAGAVVEEPMATVGADIKLCSVSLKVPVIPVRVNLAEKPW